MCEECDVSIDVFAFVVSGYGCGLWVPRTLGEYPLGRMLTSPTQVLGWLWRIDPNLGVGHGQESVAQVPALCACLPGEEGVTPRVARKCGSKGPNSSKNWRAREDGDEMGKLSNTFHRLELEMGRVSNSLSTYEFRGHLVQLEMQLNKLQRHQKRLGKGIECSCPTITADQPTLLRD